MIRIYSPFHKILLLVIACIPAYSATAQNLERGVSLNVKQMKLSDLLTEIGKRGGFFFSYGSDMVRTDSLVTVNVSNKPVRLLLDQVFNNEVAYKEAAGYIILRPAPNRLKLMPEVADEQEHTFNISGHVVDDENGAPVRYASVYENRLLVSTLTDENGFFKMKIRSTGAVTLTVSKEMYKDTSVRFLSKVTVSPNNNRYAYAADTGSNHLERSWLGRFFISSGLRRQSINIGEFITNVPVQTSFIPGWGNHGLLSGQIVNKFSLNVLSGYSAGVDGLELGGLYNLNKGNVRYVQAAGLFNAVGGHVSGVQMAGLFNRIHGNADGIQVAGLYNVSDSLIGLQMAGLINRTHQKAKGVQVAGLANIAGSAHGVQIAGIANIHRTTASGFQVAGLINKARTLKGVSIATVNIADTLEGAAINVVSFSRNGYHQLIVGTDDNFITSLAYKSGNAKLYTKIIAGVNLREPEKFYTYGFAVGHDFLFKRGSYLSTELNSHSLLSEHWNSSHQLSRFNVLMNVPLANKISVFFGPSFTVYDLGKNNTMAEQQAVVKNNKLGLTNFGSSFKGWIGWSVGVSLF